MDLALHHVDRARAAFGSFRLVGGEDGDAFGHRRAKTLQQGLGLVFMDVHGNSWIE
jgi:hypothetical protein